MTGLCHAKLYAQLPVFSGNARSEGIAGAQVMLSDHWSGILNPACLAEIDKPVLGLYCRNYYQIPGLNQFSAALAIPTPSGCFGLGYAVAGTGGLSQHHSALSFGKQVGAGVDAGIGLHCLTLQQPEGYGNYYTVLPSAGIRFNPAKHLSLAFTWFNPANQQYAIKGCALIPSIICAGVGYYFDQNVLVCFEIRKNIHHKAVCFGGFELNIIQPLFIRFGISSSECQRFSTGIGLKLSRISIDLSANQHPVLNYITAISINVDLKSKKAD
jgi:hypothetical protein